MKKAFTLVELLIVIVIIGILATMAVPQYQKMVSRSKWAGPKLIMDQIRKGELVYYAQYGYYAACAEPDHVNNGWIDIGMDSPNSNPNREFTYDVWEPNLDFTGRGWPGFEGYWRVFAVRSSDDGIVREYNKPYLIMKIESGEITGNEG